MWPNNWDTWDQFDEMQRKQKHDMILMYCEPICQSLDETVSGSTKLPWFPWEICTKRIQMRSHHSGAYLSQPSIVHLVTNCLSLLHSVRDWTWGNWQVVKREGFTTFCSFQHCHITLRQVQLVANLIPFAYTDIRNYLRV